MYFVIISNSSYPDETHTSDIFFKKPSLIDIYDEIGDPMYLVGLYHKWSIKLAKIENFKKIVFISDLNYNEGEAEEEDHLESGGGYLYEEHLWRIEKRAAIKEIKEAEEEAQEDEETSEDYSGELIEYETEDSEDEKQEPDKQ